MKLTPEKLEGWGYCMVKIACTGGECKAQDGRHRTLDSPATALGLSQCTTW